MVFDVILYYDTSFDSQSTNSFLASVMCSTIQNIIHNIVNGYNMMWSKKEQAVIWKSFLWSPLEFRWGAKVVIVFDGSHQERSSNHFKLFMNKSKYSNIRSYTKSWYIKILDNTNDTIYHIWRNTMLMYINDGKQKSLWWLFSPVKQQEHRFTRHVPQTIDEIVKLFELFSIHHNIYDV